MSKSSLKMSYKKIFYLLYVVPNFAQQVAPVGKIHKKWQNGRSSLPELQNQNPRLLYKLQLLKLEEISWAQILIWRLQEKDTVNLSFIQIHFFSNGFGIRGMEE